jgi:hypothetical protein
MKSLFQLAKILPFSAALGACVTDTGVRPQGITGAPCCAALKELPVVKLERQNLVRSKLTESSASFNFADGLAYALSFELMDSGAKRRVQIKSYTYMEWSSTGLFCPMVTFLDKDYRPIGSVEERLQYEPYDHSSSKEWMIEFDVPDAARTIVVHPIQKYMGENRAYNIRSSPIIGQIGGTLYFGIGDRGHRMATCRTMGVFDVLLK